MDSYSTRSAAKKLGIHFVTLQRYISASKIPAPKAVKVGGSTVRAWSEEDIERVRKILPTIANGRKTRYQKQKESAAAKPKKQSAQPRAAVPHKQSKQRKPRSKPAG